MEEPAAFEALKARVDSGDVHTVIASVVRPNGPVKCKFYVAEKFVHYGWKQVRFCQVVLATDPQNKDFHKLGSAFWGNGTGDYRWVPENYAYYELPWWNGHVLMFGDLVDRYTDKELPFAPRTVLIKVLNCLSAHRYEAFAAPELEFYVLENVPKTNTS